MCIMWYDMIPNLPTSALYVCVCVCVCMCVCYIALEPRLGLGHIVGWMSTSEWRQWKRAEQNDWTSGQPIVPRIPGLCLCGNFLQLLPDGPVIPQLLFVVPITLPRQQSIVTSLSYQSGCIQTPSNSFNSNSVSYSIYAVYLPQYADMDTVTKERRVSVLTYIFSAGQSKALDIPIATVLISGPTALTFGTEHRPSLCWVLF